MEIAFAGSLLVLTGTEPLWLQSDVIGEGLAAHSLRFAFWALTFFAVPLCFGSIVGAHAQESAAIIRAVILNRLRAASLRSASGQSRRFSARLQTSGSLREPTFGYAASPDSTGHKLT